jgi:hypothetical protein
MFDSKVPQMGKYPSQHFCSHRPTQIFYTVFREGLEPAVYRLEHQGFKLDFVSGVGFRAVTGYYD